MTTWWQKMSDYVILRIGSCTIEVYVYDSTGKLLDWQLLAIPEEWLGGKWPVEARIRRWVHLHSRIGKRRIIAVTYKMASGNDLSKL